MKIFFTASVKGKKTYQTFYDQILNILKVNKIEVISKEVQDYSSLVSYELINSLSKSKIHYLYMKKAIKICNAAIIECSTSSFKLGHEATLVLSKDKPLLILSQNTTYDLNLTYSNCYYKNYNNHNDIDSEVNNFINLLKSKEKAVVVLNLGEKIKYFTERVNLSQLDLECIIETGG